MFRLTSWNAPARVFFAIALLSNLIAWGFGALALLQGASSFEKLPVVALLMDASRTNPDRASEDSVRLRRDVLMGGKMTPDGFQVDYRFASVPLLSSIDEFTFTSAAGGRIRGWVVPQSARQTVVALLVTMNGELVGVGSSTDARPDVAKALNRGDAYKSGFAISLPPSAEAGCDPALFVLLASGEVAKIETGKFRCN